jgi:hypothetical protein
VGNPIGGGVSDGAAVIVADGVRVVPARPLAAWRVEDIEERQNRKDAQWAGDLVESFPLSWSRRLIDRWRSTYEGDYVKANLGHLQNCRAIAGAQRAGLSPDANDAELCEDAHQSARDMGRRVALRDKITPKDWPEGVRLLARWAEASHCLLGRGLDDAAAGLMRLRTTGAAVLARVACERWWRRVLRRVHAKGVEATARAIGLVHKRAACYVSNEGVHQRTGQLLRNERVLEGVMATNEHGQAYTLAELAARGPGNREIRRHELMTRIAGFELIAKESGHEAIFVTLTCPGRMHRMRTAGRFGVEENPKWDGTAPDEAQRYLAKQWTLARAAAARAGVDWYGFRIAEPNHDGTPHWHALLFVPALGTRAGEAVAASEVGKGLAVRILRRYFLEAVDPNEPGADKHRVKVEAIDWGRGSAAGYVAKYVSKNIDGYKVEKDLYGNDALTSSRRVDAWASRWRIRQFQQIGGAPVTVWRELRRLHPEQAGASVAVELALDAVNVAAKVEKAAGVDELVTDQDRQQTAAHGWATYTHLQGGPRVPRCDLRLRLLKESTGEVGRYGEALPAKVTGIERIEVREVKRPAFGIVMAHTVRKETRVQVESERCAWTINPKGFGAIGALPQGEALRPWSPVNNCTRSMSAPLSVDPRMLSFAGIERHAKRGRWAKFRGSNQRSDESETSNGKNGHAGRAVGFAVCEPAHC